MNSWRTSVIGAVLIVGALASLAISAFVNKRVPATEELAVAGSTIATGIGLIAARDDKKSSEDVEYEEVAPPAGHYTRRKFDDHY